MPWTEVKIAGFDKDRSHRPDPDMDLFDLYLRLSGDADATWKKLFTAVWENRTLYMMKRNVRFEGNHLVIHALPDKLKDTHLPQLRQAVERTNGEYRDLLEQQQREEERRHRQQEEDEERLDDLDDELDLDDG